MPRHIFYQKYGSSQFQTILRVPGVLGEIGYDTGSALPCEKDDADRPLSLSELQETDAGL